MNEVHIGSLDLNLLRVFDALIEARSATRAGERLGLSQSAISHALARLRYVLKDELFVRGSDGMQATARAAEIAPRLRQGLLQLELALAPTDFSPANTDRRFTFTCTEYAGAVVLPALVARMRVEAPSAEVRVLPSNLGVADSLRAGRADLAIGSYRRLPEWAAAESLMRDTRVWVIGADHPAANQEMTLERLAALPHLVISATGEDERAIDGYVTEHGLERMVTRSDAGVLQGVLAARGLRRTVAVTTPHFLAALVAISQSDIAALLPRRLAEAFKKRFRLKLIDPPYPSPSFEVQSIWHREFGEQAALVWVRKILREVTASL
ncbi:MAG TPA: LysR family transcriptional regulator [Stellaceae bacterium]|jgi:DNA-binding transcriptional LysR family regulator|nr:LysR family transcriptional regulator [Stellaceae bacterium]